MLPISKLLVISAFFCCLSILSVKAQENIDVLYELEANLDKADKRGFEALGKRDGNSHGGSIASFVASEDPALFRRIIRRMKILRKLQELLDTALRRPSLEEFASASPSLDGITGAGYLEKRGFEALGRRKKRSL